MKATLKIKDPIRFKAEVIRGEKTLYLIDGYNHVKFINSLGGRQEVATCIDLDKLGRYLQCRGILGYDEQLIFERRIGVR